MLVIRNINIDTKYNYNLQLISLDKWPIIIVAIDLYYVR